MGVITNPLARRTLLKIGGVSLASSPVDLFGAPAQESVTNARADSVLFLWLPGGVTHHESFDPKPQAPEEIRGTNAAIATTIPGVLFGEVMPRLAQRLNQFTLIRSFSHEINDHFLAQVFALSGRRVTPNNLLSEPNFGCVINKLLGPRGELPGFIAVPGSTRPGPPNTDLFVPAWLGRRFAPFCTMGEPRQPDFRVRELQLLDGVDDSRLVIRNQLRHRVEAKLAALEKRSLAGEVDSLQGDALRMLTSERVRSSFDIHAEPTKVRALYGDTKLGQRCLLARRLLERGARFVMVDYGYDWGEYNNLWDNHAVPEQHQPHISAMAKLPYHLPAVDQAFAALLDDMQSRGMLERTLIVYLTEFGRTPRINGYGGRDHWGPAGSIFFAGAGVQRGQVIGSTDHHGAYVRTTPFSPVDVIATIYSALGLDPMTNVTDPQGRSIPILPEGQVIPGVLAS